MRKFGEDRLRGLGVAMDQISVFSIDLRSRPLNTPALYRASELSVATCKA